MITDRKPKQSDLPIMGLFVVVIGTFLLYWVMSLRQVGDTTWLPYSEWISLVPKSIIGRILWFLGDMTEAQFHKNVIGAVGLIIGAVIAHKLYKRGSPCGFPICYGTGLWPSVFCASTLGLFISVFIFDFAGILDATEIGWVPTFVPFVSVPGAIVFLYGPGIKSILTGSILGALFGFPIAWFIIEKLLFPLGLPNAVGNVISMCIAGIICFEICDRLPWMKRFKSEAETIEIDEGIEEIASSVEKNVEKEDGKTLWFIRRVIADFSEPLFYGNEIASAGLILGGIIGWLINPMHPVYGSGLFPEVLASQFLASATGVFIYYKQWRELGYYPTFVPIASVSPAVVLMFGGSLQSIIVGSILGGVMCPPVAHMICRNVPKHWHPYVGNVFSMALCTLIAVWILMYMPYFGRL